MDEENSLLKLIQNASQEPTALDKKDDTKGDNSDFEDNENNEPQAFSYPKEKTRRLILQH